MAFPTRRQQLPCFRSSPFQSSSSACEPSRTLSRLPLPPTASLDGVSHSTTTTPLFREIQRFGGNRLCVVEWGKPEEKILEEKRRAELSARIASGAFTVEKSGFPFVVKNGLAKLGVPEGVLDVMFKWADAKMDYPKIPEAKGAISAIRSEGWGSAIDEMLTLLQQSVSSDEGAVPATPDKPMQNRRW
ncbi:Protein LUTEIN DEFICIENT 5, chloroplastic [Linum perenne]